MIKKKTTVTMTYGSTNAAHVKLYREENNKGVLCTKHVNIFNSDGSDQLHLSNADAYTLYLILDEIVRDGNLKCTY